jgi:hypothetical protein
MNKTLSKKKIGLSFHDDLLMIITGSVGPTDTVYTDYTGFTGCQAFSCSKGK